MSRELAAAAAAGKGTGPLLPAYRGASRAPLDLTFDIGLRMDTRVGEKQVRLGMLAYFVSDTILRVLALCLMAATVAAQVPSALHATASTLEASCAAETFSSKETESFVSEELPPEAAAGQETPRLRKTKPKCW